MPGSSSTVPKEWPQGIVYLRVPHYSKRLSSETSRVLILPFSEIPADEQLMKSTNGPFTNVRISKITNSNHPAYGQYGLFAAQHLPPDSFVLPYLGYVHDQSDTNESSDYDLSLDREHRVGVDASTMGNEARFINDYRGIAPAPTAEFRDIYIDLGNGKAEKRIGVFVLSAGKSGKRAKGVPKGQELLVSYGKGFWAARSP
ncbi:uncharacterized protein EI97DRAFT_139398 [Westerdykella ornata]|uniref:SET domain-containing protein n=1 Tax=Westerdykella ornata TaxID=318751 RepID=A0A6A6JBH9_WESOR|nr:uncharacterized protein EI97DRAFT_139398 [Westerdykella ornata]KAF2273941.1 hypothetical protein EI97DRAFT_139398 [Westerdykella ornata]